MQKAKRYLRRLGLMMLRVVQKSRGYVSIFLSGLGLAGMSWSIIALLGQTKGRVEEIDLSRGNRQDLLSLASEGPDSQASSSAEPVEKRITASIAGGVNNPGLYELPEGARVADLLAKGDGFSEQVEYRLVSQQLNLARLLKDQEHLYIPMIGDVSAGGVGSPTELSIGSTDGIEELNKATEEQLLAVSGIGKVYAGRILENKPYSSWQEVREKAKLSESLVNKLRENITASEE